jgi:hypothetical protein
MGHKTRRRRTLFWPLRYKKAAIDRAREISRNTESELYIHKKDGQIGQKDSHGGDPYPPKG